ncbi:MAG: type II toxin-antitoxin system VapC family toxin [Candidatus Thermoplasmatota archaeon]|nr:type II toxin-antitoxin system VapC family toxin [Candidatus Thermoplasmatota archaeon]
MVWLLDTNTCIYLLTGKHPDYQRNILARLDALPRNERPVISSVVLSELQYGVRKSRWRKANQALLDEFLLDFNVSDYSASAAIFYGELRTDLEKRGQPIGPMDMMIAAHALALDATLVTHNTREFARVKGLRLEDWAG